MAFLKLPSLISLSLSSIRIFISFHRVKLNLVYIFFPDWLQHRGGGWGTGFIPIAEYGAEFTKGSIRRKPKKPVRLLYSGRNHYDLLIWESSLVLKRYYKGLIKLKQRAGQRWHSLYLLLKRKCTVPCVIVLVRSMVNLCICSNRSSNDWKLSNFVF